MFHTARWLLICGIGWGCNDPKTTPPVDLSDTANDDTDDTEPASITECDAALTTPPAGATCAVVSVGTAGVLLRGDVLPEEGALHGGSVLIGADGTIACVGCDCSEDPSYAAATVVDCPDGVISPGFVNPHDHVTFAEGTPFDHGATRYDHRHDWRSSLSASSNTDTANGVRWGELRMLMSGVTSMMGSGSQAGLVRNLDSAANSALDLEAVQLQTFPLGDSDTNYHSNCDWGYSDDEAEVSARAAYLPHVAEGIDAFAAEEFRCLSNGFEGEDVTEANTAHIHGIGLSTLAYAEMAHDQAILVWSPRSDISLYGQTAQVALFAQLGGTIALGTNWVYSGSMNMGRELACASALNETRYASAFSSADLWRMATDAGARSAGATDRIGRLEPGLEADIAVFASGDTEYWEAAITAETTEVALVLRSGKALYGEADLVAALNPACEALDVCGAARAICASDETGSTYEQIRAAIPDAYPAFSCDPVPLGEPTCEPSRPDEYTGITSDDSDGDGLADAIDLCPDVFAPLRVFEAGEQPDLDVDGLGDACDPTPLPVDVDADGVDNETDVCPWAADDQADDDADGKGNACDPCPTTANPDRGCP